MNPDYQSQDNYGFLHGYINGVTINNVSKDRVAININVTTNNKPFVNKEGKEVQRADFHRAVIFTSDEKVVEQFRSIAAKLEANKKAFNEVTQTYADGYEKQSFAVEMEGVIRPQKVTNKDGKKVNGSQLYVVVKPEDIKVDDLLAIKKAADAKAAKDGLSPEERNAVAQELSSVKSVEKGMPVNAIVLVGNISSAKVLNADNKFAEITIAHNLEGKDSLHEGEPFYTKVEIDGKIPPQKGMLNQGKLFDQIASGELGVGSFVRINGKMENNNFEKTGENAGERFYGSKVSLYDINVINRKNNLSEQAQNTAKRKPAVADEKPAKKTGVVRRGGRRS